MVLVQAPRGQKTRLDWTFKHYKQGSVYFKYSFSECKGRSVFQLPEGTDWLYNGPPVKGDSCGTWLHTGRTKTTSKKVKVDEKKVAVEEAKDDLRVVVDDDAWEMEVD